LILNILLDLTQLEPGRHEGVTTYVRNLIAEFDKTDGTDRLIVLIQPGLDLPPIRRRGPVRIVERTRAQPAALPVRAFRRVSRKLGLRPEGELDRLLRRYRVQMIHYPFSTIPRSDLGTTLPITLSVMDLQHEYFPELFSPQALADRKAAFGPSAARANQIIAISNYTKQSLVEKLDVDSNKVTVIYLSGDLSQSPDNSLALPTDFAYYPAGDWAHKNHEGLFDALAWLAENRNFRPSLVLTGVTSNRLPRLLEQVRRRGLAQQVTHLGQVSYDQVAGIYARARLLVFPSRFEGFGIPIVEAMRRGVPVVCSNTTSVPEAAGEAASYFDPEDATAIADAMYRVWHDRVYADRLVTAGRKQAQQFSWERCALETIGLYRTVLTLTSTRRPQSALSRRP